MAARVIEARQPICGKRCVGFRVAKRSVLAKKILCADVCGATIDTPFAADRRLRRAGVGGYTDVGAGEASFEALATSRNQSVVA